MSESYQHVLSRVRPPRVQITYDVETLGSIQKKELPFIVGIIADLSGRPEAVSPPLKKRKFVEIDRDNFDAVMEAITPRLAFKVTNRLQSGGPDLDVKLKFRKMDDFDPSAIVRRHEDGDKVAGLSELFEARKRLSDLLAKLDGNDDLDEQLKEILKLTDGGQDKLRALLPASAKGAPAEGGSTPASSADGSAPSQDTNKPETPSN